MKVTLLPVTDPQDVDDRISGRNALTRLKKEVRGVLVAPLPPAGASQRWVEGYMHHAWLYGVSVDGPEGALFPSHRQE